jgi:hypothetical protein
MPPTTTLNLTKLTKEELGALWFLSIENIETRRAHVLLPAPGNPPNTREIEQDVGLWYQGVCSIVKTIEPTAVMPAFREMVGYIAGQAQRVKETIAA